MPPVEKPVPPEVLESLGRLYQVIDTLRSPDGCPWDMKQTVETLAPHLVEECHEMADAVARKDAVETCEELGDLLMGVMMVARVAPASRAASMTAAVFSSATRAMISFKFIYVLPSLSSPFFGLWLLS